MIIGFLAVLSAAAAAGMRIGLPLLIILLLHSDELVANLPGIGWLPPRVLIAIFTMWAVFELFGSKQLLVNAFSRRSPSYLVRLWGPF